MTVKALLLGAGFSYDLGMPLAKDVTEDFFTFYNNDRIKTMIKNLKNSNPYGNDRPINKKVMEEFFDVYNNLKKDSIPRNNYENFIKGLQDYRYDVRGCKDLYDTYNLLISKFNEYLNMYFGLYQRISYPIFKRNSNLYKWLLQNYTDKELWILSLNHDLNIEMMCIDNKIPLSFGYATNESYPISNIDFSESIMFDIQKRKNLHIKDMNFIEGKSGINLVKVHGAINEYKYDNNEKIAMASIKKCTSSYEYLKVIEKIKHKMKYYIDENPRIPFLVGGKIPISDFEKNFHILKQSVLSGGYKYSETINHKDGEETMDLFDEVLNKVDEVTIVGYSFGDVHINNRLVKAMYKNDDLKVKIVDPFYDKTPSILKPFDYNLRVTACVSSVPNWIYYSQTGTWSSDISNQLKETDRARSKMKKIISEILTN